MTASNEMPRVLMLSDVYFPRINGVSTSIQTFRRDLDTLGWPTRLVAPAYPEPWNDDPLTCRVRSRAAPLDPEDRLMSLRSLLGAGRRLAGGVDLIHIQTPFLAHWAGVKLAKELGVRTVETYHTYFEQYFHHYARFLPQAWLRHAARGISRRQCNAVDAVVSPSGPMAEVLRDYGVRTPIEVIATGLDMERFRGGNGRRFRAERGIPAARPVVLHVGRVAHEKNIGFVVDAFSRIRSSVADALLIIAGEGPALESLRVAVSAAALGDSVMFVGYLDRERELLDCYRSADAFVFASNTETQGLVILEAMAVGTPVVSTAVLGTKDVLQKGPSGAIVVPEDREAFAAAVVRILRSPALKRKLGAAGRRFVEDHWSSEIMAARLGGLYEALSGGRAPRDERVGGRIPGATTRRRHDER